MASIRPRRAFVPRSLVLLLAAAWAIPAFAQAPPTPATEPALAPTVTVVTKDAAPFVMTTEGGTLEGIAIDLWRLMAVRQAIDYSVTTVATVQEVLDAVRPGDRTIGVAALTVTTEREAVIDFTHPFFTTGWGIAVPKVETGPLWLGVLLQLLSLQSLVALAMLALLLFVAGGLVWLFERRRNGEMFPPGPREGIGDGMWWAAVTLTTVGYGDKAPRTIGGRIVAVVWMLASIVIVSGFTASIASSLTVERLRTSVQSLSDLAGVRTGALAGSATVGFLETSGIRSDTYPDLRSGLAALASGEIAAFVHDAPILRYEVHRDFRGTLAVLPHTYGRQDYAFALPEGSPLRESVNRVLVAILASEDWTEITSRYLPPQP